MSATRKNQTITWTELQEFAAEQERDITHVFRVFRGDRISKSLDAAFTLRFGFGMGDAELAGRQGKAA